MPTDPRTVVIDQGLLDHARYVLRSMRLFFAMCSAELTPADWDKVTEKTQEIYNRDLCGKVPISVGFMTGIAIAVSVMAAHDSLPADAATMQALDAGLTLASLSVSSSHVN